MDQDTIGKVADAAKSVTDAVSIPPEVKTTLLTPIAEKIGQVFQARSTVKHFEIENQAIVMHGYQEKLKERVQELLSAQPNLTFTEVNEFLLRKQINDSQYSINDEYMRERFAKLISSTVSDNNNSITPFYSDVLSNLNTETATLLISFTHMDMNPVAYFGPSRTAFVGYFEPTTVQDQFIPNAIISQGEINQLVSLGLVEMQNDYRIRFSNQPDVDLYAKIKWLAQIHGFSENDIVSYAAVGLTEFGKNFIKVVY
ncbi:Abi-alpha family protein [Weissella confusa]|uniref:Abi-alpha family protein n=1 Tax=Weissella confusa TaxID=1583 RepID=UPI003454D195